MKYNVDIMIDPVVGKAINVAASVYSPKHSYYDSYGISAFIEDSESFTMRKLYEFICVSCLAAMTKSKFKLIPMAEDEEENLVDWYYCGTKDTSGRLIGFIYAEKDAVQFKELVKSGSVYPFGKYSKKYIYRVFPNKLAWYFNIKHNKFNVFDASIDNIREPEYRVTFKEVN